MSKEAGEELPEVVAEQSRGQTAIYDLLRAELFARKLPNNTLDGAGCESGDPLDVTLAEISQCITLLTEKDDDPVECSAGL